MDRYSSFWLRRDMHRDCLANDTWKSLVFLILTANLSSNSYSGIALLPLEKAEEDSLEKRYLRVGVFSLHLCSSLDESTGEGQFEHRYDTVVII